MISRRDFFAAMLAPAVIPAARNFPGCAGDPVFHPSFSSGACQADEEVFWRNLRKQFLIPENETFFNTATLGASPRIVLETVTGHMREIERTLAHWDYRPEHPDWFSGYRPETSLREKLAALIHAEGEEVALVQNATLGMNFIAHGLNLKPGDEVLSTDQEHPGGRCGWELRTKRYGTVWHPVAIPIPPASPEQIVELIQGAISPRTRVLAIPQVTSLYGIVMPVTRLCEIARSRGIFTVIDGAQAVGQIPVDVRAMGCDAYFSSPHKWLLAPKGCGFLCVRKGALKDVWTTLASTEWDSQDKGAYRLMQFGTGNLSLLKGLEAAIEFNQKIGQYRISQRIIGMARQLRQGLQRIQGVTIRSPVHPELSAAMTTYRIDKLPASRLMDELWNRRRIRVRAVGDSVGVRHSVHLYNFPGEIDATLEVVRDLAG